MSASSVFERSFVVDSSSCWSRPSAVSRRFVRAPTVAPAVLRVARRLDRLDDLTDPGRDRRAPRRTERVVGALHDEVARALDELVDRAERGVRRVLPRRRLADVRLVLLVRRQLGAEL